jgi:PAS domain S-box-containing protein
LERSAEGTMPRMKTDRRWVDDVNETGSIPRTEDNPATIHVHGAARTSDGVPAMVERITDSVFAFDRTWRTTHVNQAGARFIGNVPEHLVGLTPQQLFPEAIGLPFFDAGRQAEATGEPAHVQAHYPPLGGWLEASVYPSSDGYTVMLRDVSARKRSEEALQVKEARESLLLRLMQGQRERGDPDAMMGAAAEALRQQLDVNRVGFFEMIDDETLGFTVCDTDGTLAPLSGTFPAVGIGTRYLAEVRAGRTLGIADARHDPLTVDSAFAEIGTRSLIGAPIVRGGRWQAGLYVNHATVREWTADEIALVREVADQTWDAVERARAELALRESESRFRAVWEATSDAISLSGPDGIVLVANPAYLALYGYEEAEIVGHNFAVIFPKDLREFAAEQYQLVFTNAEANFPQAYQTRVLRKDGSERSVESRVDFVMEGGRRTATVSAVRDVTDRQAIETALRVSEDRLRMALDSARMGVYTWDPIADTTDVDDRLREVVGLKPGEDFSLAAALSVNIHPDDRARYAAAAEALVDPTGPGVLIEEVRWINSSGDERWLAFSGQAFFEGEDADRRAVRVVGGALEVTMRKRAEEDLRASEERFRTLIQRSTDAIQLFAPDGTILYSSDSVEAVLGYSPDEMVGRSVVEYIHSDELAAFTAWLADIISVSGNVGTMEYRVRHKNGSWAWVETTLSNHLGTPSIDAIVGNFRNVTERRRADIVREAFTASAAHDLKTPLTSLMGQAQLMIRRTQRGKIDPFALESGLGAINAAARRMVSLIDEMMDAARLEAGRTLDLHSAATDMVALAEAAVEEGRVATTRHVVRLVAEIPSLIGVWDAPRLGRVLGNLIGNAIKYSPLGGEVVVKVERQVDAAGAWAVVHVGDRGVGIPADDLPHIFERFRRGGNVAGQIGGTGIGLSGATLIVEQYGGTLSVESSEGDGSTFTMRLPLERENGNPASVDIQAGDR